VQNSISRETLKATRVSFGSAFGLDLFGAALPSFATICKN
jgi:hypothetical protein